MAIGWAADSDADALDAIAGRAKTMNLSRHSYEDIVRLLRRKGSLRDDERTRMESELRSRDRALENQMREIFGENTSRKQLTLLP
jgi:hypothetical protein